MANKGRHVNTVSGKKTSNKMCMLMCNTVKSGVPQAEK